MSHNMLEALNGDMYTGIPPLSKYFRRAESLVAVRSIHNNSDTTMAALKSVQIPT